MWCQQMLTLLLPQGRDLDGDGDVDLVSGSYYDNKIAWYENDGQLNFTEHIVTTEYGAPRALEVLDFDKDGDLDLIVASTADDRTNDERMKISQDGIYFYENINGAFHPIHLADQQSVIRFKLADLNADGFLDVSAKAAWGGGAGNASIRTL